LKAEINKSSFFASQLLIAFFTQRSKLKILFSEHAEREKNIRKGFRFLRHEISFKAFTPENIKANDLAIPLTMCDLRNLAQMSDLKNDLIPIPDLSVIDICDDKYLFSQVLNEKGFGDAVPKIGKHLSYPYMLKKKVAQSGDDCYVISNADQEKEFEDSINHRDYFCQEIIPGNDEYATHIVFKDHKITSSINVKYLFPGETFVKGKDKFICTEICDCPYLELFASILDAIGFEGLCCFNYKVIDNKPLILEINPRFGGSLSTFFFSFIGQLDRKAS
jgi:hypothetical protein